MTPQRTYETLSSCDGSGVYYARDGAKDGVNALANATFALLMKFALIKVAY